MTTFVEDFSTYGDPYSQVIPSLPPEFSYSVATHTNGGPVVPTSYNRKGFSIQHPASDLHRKNPDKGLHKGTDFTSGYYLLFPIMDWYQIQTLELNVLLSADGMLTYEQSFDGYIGDVHTVVINGKVVHEASNTVGHPGTTRYHQLAKGRNRIVWVLECRFANYVVRGGVPIVVGHTPMPLLYRYFRLSNIQVTNFSSVITPRQSWSNVIGAGTVSCNTPMLDEVARATLVGTSSCTVGVVSGTASLVVFGSFITNARRDKTDSAFLTSDSTTSAYGSINHIHSSEDAGLVIDTQAELTVEIPLDTRQTITELVQPIPTTFMTMNTPVVINGKPVIPTYFDAQPSSFASLSTWHTTSAVDPASVDHVLPHTATDRWVSVDITGAIDDPVTAWPNRNSGGPSFLSLDLYCPTIHPHEHFVEKDFSYVTYAQVVTFYWRYVQHMWASLGSVSLPFTWSFVGIFTDPTKKQWHHILDNGLPTSLSYVDDVQDVVPVQLNEGPANTRAFFGVYDNGVATTDQFGHPYMVKGHIDWRPVIYTVVFEPLSTTIYARHRKHHWHRTVGMLNSSTSNFLLGREQDWVSEEHASHMSLMEVAFFNRGLTINEIRDNEDWLMGVYQFDRYI